MLILRELGKRVVGVTIIESDNSTDLFEGTTTDTYTIALNSKPTSSVVININFDSSQLKLNEITISPVQISFSTENWNQPQTVSVLAIYDNILEGNHKAGIVHTIPSQNPLFGPSNIGTVIANITDNQGSKLKNSLQSGIVTLGGTNPLSVTLTNTVDSSKSYVYCNFQASNSSVDRAPTCQLSVNGDSILVESGNSGSATIVNWYVVEFATGAFVQRGSNSLLSPELTKVITLSTAIDMSRTFVITYSRTTNTNSNIDEERTLRSRLLNATSLEVSRNESGIPVNIEWQVIQLDSARVQSGINTIPNGLSSVAATIRSVNLGKAFIIMNLQAGTNVNGVETDYYVRAMYTSKTGLSFIRTGTNDTVDISWFAIEMLDESIVQSGNSNVSSISSSITSNLNSVETTKTMILFSNQVETGSGPTVSQDSSTFISTLVSSISIQFDRAVAEDNACIISWYAVQFH